MSKLNLLGVLVGVIGFQSAYAVDIESPTVSAETTVAADASFMDSITPTLGTWVEGDIKAIEEATAIGGRLFLQLDAPLADWKVGVMNRIKYSFEPGMEDRIKWDRLRLFGEKKGFVDTGDISNRFTLRLEPRTATPTKEQRILHTITRFDFVFPIDGAVSFKLREEPILELNELSSGGMLYNGLELGPVFTMGSLLVQPHVANWQRVSNSGVRTAGYTLKLYTEYGISENLLADLYAEVESQYSHTLDFSKTYWAFELAYSF